MAQRLLRALKERLALDPLGKSSKGAHRAPRPPNDDHHHEHEAEPDVPGDRRTKVETRYGRAEETHEDHRPEHDLIRQDEQELELAVTQHTGHEWVARDVQPRGRVGRAKTLGDPFALLGT